jgi:hypothetical protein
MVCMWKIRDCHHNSHTHILPHDENSIRNEPELFEVAILNKRKQGK